MISFNLGGGGNDGSMFYTTGGGGSTFGGSGYPTSQFDVGDTLKDLGNQALEGVATQLGDALGDWVNNLFKDPSGQGAVIAVQPGKVLGLAGLYAYMLSNPPPADSKGRADKGNWVRYASTAVLGIPHDIVWRDETTKRQTYELFRAYLGAYDNATGGKYFLKNTIPPSQPPQYSDNDQARPYALFLILQQIGEQGLKAIDLSASGYTIDATSVEILTEQAQSDAGGDGALDKLWEALDGIKDNILQTLGTVGQSAVEGAVGGAQATSQGANTGAQTARAAFFGIPATTLLIGVGLIVVLLLFRRK